MATIIECLASFFKRPKTKEKWIGVEHYIAACLLPSDPDLDRVLQSTEAFGLPPIAVTPSQGKLLNLLASAIGARAILEIGTLAGYSTIWLARALAEDGKLITLEANPDYAKIAIGNIVSAGLSDKVELRVGEALDLLPTLHKDGPFDFIFIDADHRNMAAYFEWGIELSRPGSLIVVDNVVRGGRILDAEVPKGIRGIRRFYDVAAVETKASTTVIQTVGAKGHDGFAVARVL